MRKAAILALALAFVAGMTLPAWAAAKSSSHGTHGEFVSMDAAAKTFVVKEKAKSGEEKEVTFAFSEKTKVTVHGKPGKMEDLKAGDAVHVQYTVKENVNHASSVSVSAPPAAKPAEPKK